MTRNLQCNITALRSIAIILAPADADGKLFADVISNDVAVNNLAV